MAAAVAEGAGGAAEVAADHELDGGADADEADGVVIAADGDAQGLDAAVIELVALLEGDLAEAIASAGGEPRVEDVGVEQVVGEGEAEDRGGGLAFRTGVGATVEEVVVAPGLHGGVAVEGQGELAAEHRAPGGGVGLGDGLVGLSEEGAPGGVEGEGGAPGAGIGGDGARPGRLLVVGACGGRGEGEDAGEGANRRRSE